MLVGDLLLLSILLGALLNMIVNVVGTAEINNRIGALIIKCNMVRISRNGFAIMQLAKNYLINKRQFFQKCMKVLLDNVWCWVGLNADPGFATFFTKGAECSDTFGYRCGTWFKLLYKTFVKRNDSNTVFIICR